jgi:hypothetical protein
VTSYLAVEPGVRPSIDGLELEGFGAGGGGSAYGRGGGIGLGRVPNPPPALAKLLADDITRCARTHVPSQSWRIELDVETTDIEIVDVEAKQASHAGMRTCIVEAVWALELPPADWPARETYRVTLP